MTRSPLAYPLIRGIDGDAGGAADLQTDIMRFMAILALCLVAIFALVQSIPLVPEPAPPAPAPTPPPAKVETAPPEPVVIRPTPVQSPAVENEKRPVLTRPKWQPKFNAAPPESATEEIAPPEPVAAAEAKPPVAPPSPATNEQGFTLRFESDLALTRLVASNRVGFYAIAAGRSQRMTISDSRISFWDASSPNMFHEMDASTVPVAVIDALARAGTDTGTVDWGVTLPSELSQQLNALMRDSSGGSLVIGIDGQLRLEAT